MADIHVDQLTTQNFYQIPQIFFTRVEKTYDKKGGLRFKTKHTSSYARMSNDAKIAYGALYNRCMLSIRSYQEGKIDYVDENGSVFLVYTVEDLMDLLDKSKATVQKIKKELAENGLLREVKQGSNKPNRIYLQNVEASREVHEKYEALRKKKERKVKGKVKIVYEFNFRHIMTLDHLGNVIFKAETSLQNDDMNGQLKIDRPNLESGRIGSDRPDGQNLNRINIEKSKIDNLYDTNRYKSESPLSDLSISEAFKMGQHGFLSPQLVQKLSLFGKDAKILENKIYQAKRQVEKNYNNLLADQEIYGEVWLQDLERELDKLIFKIKTGEAEEKPIQNVPAYFYKMMIRFWKMALLIEKEQGFMELSGQSEHARKFPDECPSLIAYYYPDKLSETKLNEYLAELSKNTETC
ncbi:replication initiator protein A [Streptococcus anginosus]|uniref:replication initiator protein A n=1 Tax=Streptococcus anginosus TaxID=1328 RepID=UPI0021F8F413|nr:replication initiator protein A [Streptococcus anginosus]MCW1010444.1 replication initiator protein A [Streptococcus anginosus]